MVLLRSIRPVPPILINRDFRLPEDGWFHVLPKGEFQHDKIVQVMDEVALSAIKNRFDEEAMDPNFPGILVDFDHFSTDETTPSEAAGWIEKLENRPTGLYAQIRWSDVGEQAIKGGRYRQVSPVFLVSEMQPIAGNRMRPTRLDSVALTNAPRMKAMEPLTNREGDKDKKMDYKKQLLNMLELPETATDEEIQGKCDAAKAKRLEMANSASQLAVANTEVANRRAEVATLKASNEAVSRERDALLGEQVERDLVEFDGVIQNKEFVKKQLLANRAGTIEFLRSLKPAGQTDARLRNAGKAPLHDATKAGQPPISKDAAAASVRNTEEAQHAPAIRARAREIMAKNRNLPFSEAWRAARSEVISGLAK